MLSMVLENNVMSTKNKPSLFETVKDFFNLSSGTQAVSSHFYTSFKVDISILKRHSSTAEKAADMCHDSETAILQAVADKLKIPAEHLKDLKAPLFHSHDSVQGIRERAKEPLTQIQCFKCQHHTASTHDWCMYCGEKLPRASNASSQQIVDQKSTESLDAQVVADPLKVRLRNM